MWIDPASIEWDWTFHRPLFHETLHFWQLLCSPYLARMIAAERAQLEIFEATNTVRQSTIYREQFTRVDEEVGFSAEHLLESWARFWEIQVQTPARLLEQENFKRHKLSDAMWKISDPNGPFFKKWYWSSLEVAMTQGSNCQLYGRPFRWMHSQVCAAARITPNALDEFNPRGFMPAYLVCSAYPSLLYASFRTDDPVSHFKTAVQRICDDAFLIGRFCSDLHAHFYELEWYNHWESFNEVVGTTSPLPMASGQLWSPFVASEKEFLDVGAKIFEMLDPDTFGDPSVDAAHIKLVEHGPSVAFAHMGHRPFGLLLATLSAPPLMFFRGEDGLVQHSYRASEADQERLDECTVEAYHLKVRLDRFKRARKAKELGLPIDAFEGA